MANEMCKVKVIEKVASSQDEEEKEEVTIESSQNEEGGNEEAEVIARVHKPSLEDGKVIELEAKSKEEVRKTTNTVGIKNIFIFPIYRRVGTVGGWPQRQAAGVAWRGIVDHSVSTRTGKITQESAGNFHHQSLSAILNKIMSVCFL